MIGPRSRRYPPPVPDVPESATRLCSRVLGEIEAQVESLLGRIADPGGNAVLLDVGCWEGVSTLKRARALGADRILGIEIYEHAAAQAAERGIELSRLDMETEGFPWPDDSVDVVVCNQVLEHLKNIWLPMSEMHRVLRPGGHAILSVPNLASLHNRFLLAFGRQPTSIRTFGPHIRGYTLRQFRELIGRDGAYEIEATRGAGFYPLTSPWSRPFSAAWPGASHTIVVMARKAGRKSPWARQLTEQTGESGQTFYSAEPTPAS